MGACGSAFLQDDGGGERRPMSEEFEGLDEGRKMRKMQERSKKSGWEVEKIVCAHWCVGVAPSLILNGMDGWMASVRIEVQLSRFRHRLNNP